MLDLGAKRIQLLQRVRVTIQDGKTPNLDAPLEPVSHEVNLHASTLIPESYLPDVHSRLIMYKRIANATDVGALRELQVEMIDRFGLLPDQAKTLFRITELKLKTERVGVRRIEAGPDGGRIVFDDQPKIDFGHVMRLIQERSNIYRLDGQDRLRFTLPLPDVDSRIKTVDQLLADIAA